MGKTTISAALAMLMADNGRRVLLVELDTESSLKGVFGVDEIATEPTEIMPNISACVLDPNDCMQKFVQRFVPSKRVARLMLENKAAQIFFHSAPSVREAVILDQLAELADIDDDRFDVVVVDMPASGHAVKLLSVPRSMGRMVAVGDLADHLKKLAAMLEDEHHAELVVVALPEEMPVNETIELVTTARDVLRVPLRHVVVNGVREPSVTNADVALVEEMAVSLGPGASTAMGSLVDGLRLASFWRTDDAQQVARLRSSVRAKVCETPFVFRPTDDRSLVRTAADALRRCLSSEVSA